MSVNLDIHKRICHLSHHDSYVLYCPTFCTQQYFENSLQKELQAQVHLVVFLISVIALACVALCIASSSG